MTTPIPSHSPHSRRLRWLGLGLLLAGLALAAPGFAGAGDEGCDHDCPHHAEGMKHGGPGWGTGAWIEHHAAQLGIDDATLAEIRTIAKGAREDGKALHEAKRAAHDELRALLDQDEPDRDAVMAKVEALGDLETRQHKQRVATILAIRDELSPEQRAELKELREQMRGKHDEMRKKHHGHHGKTGCHDPGEGADQEA